MEQDVKTRNGNLLALLMVAVAGGFVLAYLYFNTSVIRPQKEKIALLEEAVEGITPPLPEKIFGLAGQIISKKESSLVLEMNSLKNRVPKNGELPKERRTVLVGASTVIKELIFSRAKLGSAPIEKLVSLGALLIGDQIIVTARENIKEKNEFTASLIQKHIFE